MILLGHYSRARMRVKEGASAEGYEEHRESVRLKVYQRNVIVSRSVEWLQDSMLEVAPGDRIYPSALSSSKRPIVMENEDSQPRCICIV